MKKKKTRARTHDNEIVYKIPKYDCCNSCAVQIVAIGFVEEKSGSQKK